jgi:hypothetical protein
MRGQESVVRHAGKQRAQTGDARQRKADPVSIAISGTLLFSTSKKGRVIESMTDVDEGPPSPNPQDLLKLLSQHS